MPQIQRLWLENNRELGVTQEELGAAWCHSWLYICPVCGRTWAQSLVLKPWPRRHDYLAEERLCPEHGDGRLFLDHQLTPFLAEFEASKQPRAAGLLLREAFYQINWCIRRDAGALNLHMA